MKKIFLLVLSTLVFSCQVQENTPLEQLTNSQGDSMIDELEASGTKLFKTDLQVFDAAKKNSVTLRIAAESKEVLDYYLSTTEMALKVHKSLEDLAVKSAETSGSVTTNNDATHTIYEDVLSKRFETGVVAYTVEYVKKNNKNARMAANGYSYDNWHDGETSSWIAVKCSFTNNQNPDIFVKWKARDCYFCFWRTREEGQIVMHGSKTYRREGARKLACEVNHNWGNYEFTRSN